MRHALLAPSAGKRWINCPPSARLALQYPDTGSAYAEEGTVAHALAEIRLTETLTQAGYTVLSSPGPVPSGSEYYGREMEDYIAQYALQVQERTAALHAPVIMLEEYVSFDTYVPESFGTADVILISDGVLEIIDLKYGKGVPVSADRNAQLMLYSLGAVLKYGDVYDIHTVRVTIMQPRLDIVSTYELSAQDLLTWAEETVRPAAQLAWDGEGEFAAGDWCRFCPAAAQCRARADENLQLLKYEFRDPPTLENGEIAQIMPKIAQLLEWGESVKEYVRQKILKGEEFTGWKVVERGSKRRYTDESAIAKVLQKNGFKPEQFYTQKLLGLGDMTKLLGKQGLQELLGPYIEKPPGQPVLVPESDKRPPMALKTTAADDFTALEDE